MKILNPAKLASIGLIGLCCLPALAKKKEKQPNVLYIVADDLGYSDVTCYNKESKISTTNLDRLASQGMMFTDAHTSSSVCTPTRYGILTGHYNWRSTLKKGVLGGYDKMLIEPDRLTVADLFKNKGYQTACIGKWHLGLDWSLKNGTPPDVKPRGYNDKGLIDFNQELQHGPTDLGFDYFYGISASLDMPPYIYIENKKTEGVPTTTKTLFRKGLAHKDFEAIDVLPVLGDKASEYIRQQESSKKPFFMYLPLTAPHTPILPTKEFQGKSGINKYADFVLMVDHVVGQVLRALKESGLEENTLVIFTSDNGCSPAAKYKELLKAGHNPSYIYRGHKADIYEGGHRVPFMVRWPGKVDPNSQCDQTICTTDLMATAAALTGSKLPDNAGEDSYNMLPLLLDKKMKESFREATVHHSIRGAFAIRKGDWKLAMCPGSGGWSYPRPGKDKEVIAKLPKVQLFNLKEDPSEKNNVSVQHPEKVKELQALLTKYVQEGHSTKGKKQENEGGSHWKQLWWIPTN